MPFYDAYTRAHALACEALRFIPGFDPRRLKPSRLCEYHLSYYCEVPLEADDVITKELSISWSKNYINLSFSMDYLMHEVDSFLLNTQPIELSFDIKEDDLFEERMLSVYRLHAMSRNAQSRPLNHGDAGLIWRTFALSSYPQAVLNSAVTSCAREWLKLSYAPLELKPTAKLATFSSRALHKWLEEV